MKQIFALVIVVTVTACGSGSGINLLGQRNVEGVKSLQATYVAEFDANAGAQGAEAAFPRTLQAIAAQRAGGANAQLEAYLDVLEGMILLQTGQSGQAALLKDDVVAAAPRIRAGNSFTPRDVLFAETFPLMVDGRATADALAAGSGSNAAKADAVASLAQISTAIQNRLCAARGSLPRGQQDGGAAYVAGVASAYLTQADATAGRICALDPNRYPACAGWANDREYVRTARDLRGTFNGPAPQPTVDDRIRRVLSGDGISLTPQDACS